MFDFLLLFCDRLNIRYHMTINMLRWGLVGACLGNMGWLYLYSIHQVGVYGGMMGIFIIIGPLFFLSLIMTCLLFLKKPWFSKAWRFRVTAFLITLLLLLVSIFISYFFDVKIISSNYNDCTANNVTGVCI